MGAIPSANYYESDIDIYHVSDAPKNAKILNQRHSFYDNSGHSNNRLVGNPNNITDTNTNTNAMTTTRLKSLPNTDYFQFIQHFNNIDTNSHIGAQQFQVDPSLLTKTELALNQAYCHQLSQKLETAKAKSTTTTKKPTRFNKLFAFGHHKKEFLKSKSSHNIGKNVARHGDSLMFSSSKNLAQDAAPNQKPDLGNAK